LEFLNELLSSEYKTYTASNGEAGIQIARTAQPDLILLDLFMPGMCGNSTCETLRKSQDTQHIPIIIITGGTELDPRVRVLTAGADDIITKPYEIRELMARVHSKMRRIEERAGTSKTLQCGNLVLDLQKLEVTIEGRTIPISVLEFNLLRFFIENVDRVVSRQNILDSVWKESVVSDRTVDTHMASLRRKLAGFDHNFKTVYSAGYILKRGAVSKSFQEKSSSSPDDPNYRSA
jgi:DNA-binding response OmpR family regulator